MFGKSFTDISPQYATVVKDKDININGKERKILKYQYISVTPNSRQKDL